MYAEIYFVAVLHWSNNIGLIFCETKVILRNKENFTTQKIVTIPNCQQV